MLPLPALLVLAIGILGIRGQPSQMFEWGFTKTFSTSLPSCRNFSIEASPRKAHGIPPFYMIAFAVGGKPSTTFIGTNESNLWWTVRHPVGTQLLLGVVDSQGNSGGIDVPMYTVTAGANTQCIPAATPSEPSFTISANVTGTLTTCQPWGLTIQGGAPPYNVTLATLNSSDVTNVTLGANDSFFTYINRAVPNTQMIGKSIPTLTLQRGPNATFFCAASVSDLNGLWATGSPIVRTQGSANVDCPGQADNSGAVRTSAMSRARIGIITGASAAGLVLLVCGAVIWMVQRRRRRPRAPSAGIAPFYAYPGDDARIGPAGYLPSHKSTLLALAGSQHPLPLILISSDSHFSAGSVMLSSAAPSSASPSGSPLPRVYELPPPYMHPGSYERRF
ncbi:hypothetical protein DFH09DRAFT_1294352 [Mycena vulgaris]|nr:hypothetical protein DFH09DRAFT_1294352 [Mycena vulgaris]